MSGIFSNINTFQKQTKENWIDSLYKEGINHNSIKHNINNFLFDPIYFKEEIKENLSFSKKKSWNISFTINCKKLIDSNKICLDAIKNGAQSILFILDPKKKYKKEDLIILNLFPNQMKVEKVVVEYLFIWHGEISQ